MALTAEDRTHKTLRAAMLHKGLHDYHKIRRDESRTDEKRREHHEKVQHHRAHFERLCDTGRALLRTVLPSEEEGKKAYESAVEHVNKNYGPASRFNHEEARNALRRVEDDLARDVKRGAEEIATTASIGDIDRPWLEKRASEEMASYALNRALAENSKKRLEETGKEEYRKSYSRYAKAANEDHGAAIHYAGRDFCEREAPYFIRSVREEYGNPQSADFDRERAEQDADKV